MRRLLVVPLVLVAVLAGCTAAPDPEPVIDAVAVVMPEPVVVSGQGEQTADLTVPDGAESLQVRLACTHGRYSVSSTSDFSSMIVGESGECGGGKSFVVPLPSSESMPVSITVEPDATVVAELLFSPQPIRMDTNLAEDCEALGEVQSHFMNADAGYVADDLDAAGWRDRMDEGVAVLDGMTPTPLFAEQVQLVAQWARTASEAGIAQRQQPRNAALMGSHCDLNNTELILMAEYGG